jgi:hypothetical protein
MAANDLNNQCYRDSKSSIRGIVVTPRRFVELGIIGVAA